MTVAFDFDFDGEEWQPISDFPYEVSSHGRVRRTSGGSNNTYPGRVLKGYSVDGYVMVRLCVHGKASDRKVYRLVCEAFHGAPPSVTSQVCHIDGNPANNHYTNLRWGTAADNAADRDRHGRTARGEKHSRRVISDAQVREIRAEALKTLGSRQRLPKGWKANAAERYGITAAVVSYVTAKLSQEETSL